MKSSKQTLRDAKSLFRACRVNGLLDEGRVRSAVTSVIHAKPRGYVDILQRFQRLVKLDLDRRTAIVESAVPLDDSLRKEVTASLAHRHGAGLTVAFSVNPALIGGLRIRVGSDVYDGTVAARLNTMAEKL